MTNKLRVSLITGAALGLIALVLVSLITYACWPSVSDQFEAKTLDWRYRGRLKKLWHDRQGNPIEDIIIIDIDNRSLEKLGRFDQWPRNYHAQIIDYVTAGGALAIGFDVLFMEPDKDPDMDQQLIDATSHSSIVYHAMAFSREDPNAFLYKMDQAPTGLDTERLSFSLSEDQVWSLYTADRMDGKVIDLYNAATQIGFANFWPDNDGVIRTMPLLINFAGHQYPALSLAMVLGVLGLNEENIEIVPEKKILLHPPGATKGQTLQIPIDKQGRMLINYRGTFQTFRYISYYDVLMQRLPPETFEGRIVLVGTSAAGLADIRPVPFQDAFPGVEIIANVIYDILTQDYVNLPSSTVAVLIFIFLSLVVAIMAMLLRPLASTIFWLLISVGYAYLCAWLFASKGIWFELVRPTAAMFMAMLFTFMYRYVDEERKKKHIKGMFQHYLSASVVEELLRNPDMLNLGGERRLATAFFSDIRSFTTVSESLSPEELVAQLNEYLAVMSEIVLNYEGFLDKYEGDAIMAVFGVPLDQKDHATRACLAALDMQEEMVNLRRRWSSQQQPEFFIRIGINSGPMIAGNIGGKHRFDYTVIGDAVNLASRLEGANKAYGTDIMFSEFTKDLLGNEFATRELDLLRVKGKTEPVRVFELVAKNTALLSDTKRRAIETFGDGLKEYHRRDWDAAIETFKQVLEVDPNDGPTKTYIKRCEFYKQHPVPTDWDGVFEMTTK